jgi:hypothetical protein
MTNELFWDEQFDWVEQTHSTGEEPPLATDQEASGRIKPAVFKAVIVGGLLATGSFIGYTWEAVPTHHGGVESKIDRSMLEGLAGLFGTGALCIVLEGISNFPVIRSKHLEDIA